jgi:hypothetical protein
MTAAILLFALSASAATAPLSVAARVDAERTVERTRYRFVIDATTPFDEAYPRRVFERKVERELAKERQLRERFGVAITMEMMAAEFDRIERDTRAPGQWIAIKQALGNDRRLVEEAVCRPLVVDRLLRARD